MAWTFYTYAAFLKSQDRNDEARYWVQQILEKKRTLPLYKEHIERPWFRKEKALLKELAVSWAQAVVRQLQSISSYASSSASLFPASPDRKSTRLNSSHLVISYAV